MSGKRIAFQTFGCKLNFSETSTISRIVREKGYEPVKHNDIADVYVIHSCSVTGHAEKKCRAAIRQAKKRNPSARIAVLGCFAQLRPEQLEALDEVDLILGSKEKYNLHEYLDQLNNDQFIPGNKSFAGDIMKPAEYHPAFSMGDRTRSFLKIQDGCDYFCAYCTIPMARGRSRSYNITQTMKLAEEIAGSGAKEIILTGVNIGDFGKNHKEDLLGLMHRLEDLHGIERIRLSSVEPDLLSNEIIDHVNKSDKFLPHFHIPLQSGSDKILKLMNRKYRLVDFDDRVGEIKSLMPGACIAADVIVGFPGEREEDFMDTYSYIKAADLSYVHVFTYSSRPGTKASGMKGLVPALQKRKRSEALHKLSDEKKYRFYSENIGQTGSVLFESDNHSGEIQGWTGNYLRVKTAYDPSLVNTIVEVRLEELDQDNVFKGTIINLQK
jgi:threonylcarbamoyladenosine tRNA methylthiotransferase MtaB